MATFVLVHGAFHGGWCWRKLTPWLRAAGHEVYTPTLTGMGERVHLASPAVTLSTHVQDIVNVLVYEDLAEVRLVGHSYAGFVIAGVAEQVAERLAHLVYLDARIPQDGEALRDGYDLATLAMVETQVRGAGEGWRVPVPDLGRHPFGIRDEADAGWVMAKLVPHPFATLVEPLRLTQPAAERLPRTFIACTADQVHAHAERARSAPGWRYQELPTGHDAMVTAPRELVDLLLGVI